MITLNKYILVTRESISSSETETPSTSLLPLKNAETSAIGRALASAGYGGKKFASAEEMSRIEAKTKARESQIPHSSAPLLKVVEDARQQADISVEQLKQRSQNLFGTDDIRALSGIQLKRIASEISNGKN